MLKDYKTKFAKSIIQYLVMDFDGLVIESDDVLFSNLNKKNLADFHPFFESLIPLLSSKNEEFIFSCIHLEVNGKKIISDIILQTFDGDKLPFLIIHDLTTHYSNYQTTAQVRNESVINAQIFKLKNNYLKEKEAFKNTFIANFSHELRDPLTGIITFSDILSKTKTNSEQREYLSILKSSSSFLKKMIDDILDLSKIEAGQLELIIEPFDLLELLNDIKSYYKIIAKEKGITFNYVFNSKLPKIVGGDVYRLRQVLTNLLDNAFKFTDKGSVTFSVSLNQIRAQKASIYFEISDTGIGIKEDDFDEIFNSFSQLNNANKYKGSGLGLSISKYLVELTHSKINVQSSLGNGSTFSTSINFICNSNLELQPKKTNSPLEFSSDRKYNILLVDDSDITQLSVLKILASQGNFFLDIATKPEDIIARVTNPDQELDLILMDIKLKENRGDEITKIIRKLPEREFRKIPIVALTAKVFKEDLKLYKKAGINDVVKKPFDENTLLKTMIKYLN